MSSRIAAALAVVAIAAVPARSGANDAKAVGTSSCAVGMFDPLGVEFTTNGAKNVSGALLMLECSIERDNTGNTNGLADLELRVTDPRGRLVCDAFSFDRAGNVLAVSSRVAAGPGQQTLDFGNSLNVSASKGHYAISCFMDLGTQVHSIFVDEF